MKRLAVLLVVAAVLLGSCGAQGQGQGVGETWNESRSIQPEDARSVRAHLTMGAGESDLDLDSLTLTSLDLEMGAGEPKVDLTGDYAQDFDVSIEGGVGEATVLVPSEVGVRVWAEGGLDKINVEGFQREGEA